MTEWYRMSALELAEGIRTRAFSSEEVTSYFLDRIPERQEQVGAFALFTPKTALQAARKADKKVGQSAPEDLPLLHGVPSGIKDLVLTRGIRTQLGSRAYKYFIPPFSAPMVPRVEAGGLVSCGKLATSEMGVLPVTENQVGPPARNPWDLTRSSGGSSGGSSAALASGMLPLVHASDGGGSIRIPASFCYRYGFKPSLSLLGNLHGKVNTLGLSVMGPISLTVEDAAAYLDVLSLRPPSGGTLGPCLQASRKRPEPLRIGLITEGTVGDVDPEYAAAATRAAHVLEQAGHTVVPLKPIQSTVAEFEPIWAYQIARVPVLLPGKLQPITRMLRAKGKTVSFERARSVQEDYTARVNRLFDTADVILSPTVPRPAPHVGEFPQDNPAESFTRLAEWGSLTALFNLTNGPAASIPFGFTTSGFPIGVQLGGRLGDDHRILALSRQVEEMAPWRDFWPAIAQ